MIAFSNTEITKAYLGSTEIDKIYLGEDLVFGGSPTPVVPYDAQVEYLLGDGSIYINTGIKAAGNIQIKAHLIDFFSTTYYGKWPFGGRNGSNNKMFGFYINGNNGKAVFAYNSRATEYSVYSTYPSTCDVEIGNGVIKIGAYTYTYSSTSFTSSYNIILFGLQNGATALPMAVKIGSVYITNGTTTLDLIPVRVGQVGYMYDKISGNLLSNSGSGTFILGNDVMT